MYKVFNFVSGSVLDRDKLIAMECAASSVISLLESSTNETETTADEEEESVVSVNKRNCVAMEGDFYFRV